MKPTCFCLNTISSLCVILSSLLPAITISPPVTCSRPASTFKSVDFPLPLLPTMQQSSPGIMLRSTPLSACMSTLPTRYTLVTFLVCIMGCTAAFLGTASNSYHPLYILQNKHAELTLFANNSLYAISRLCNETIREQSGGITITICNAYAAAEVAVFFALYAVYSLVHSL